MTTKGFTLSGSARAGWGALERVSSLSNNAENLPLDSALATVILPAFNESLALPKVLSEISAVMGRSAEVIVVDDGSTDGTASVAEKYPCRLIQHTCNRGKGAAVRTGIQHACSSRIVIMDADATYPSAAIPHIVELLGEYEMVRCVRQICKENMPVVNQVGNRLFNFLLTGVFRLYGDDQLSGLYGLRRDTLLRMNLESEGFDLEAEISFKAQASGLKVATFPIVYQSRLGKKKLRAWRDGWRILKRIGSMILIYNPSSIFMLPGLILMLLALSGASILKETFMVSPYLGLSIPGILLIALGVFMSFQLLTFGLAAGLYGAEAGYRPKPWMVKLCSARLRLCAGGIGIGLVAFGSISMVSLLNGWWISHNISSFQIESLVIAITILIWGLQLLSAALFITIFAGRSRPNTLA
jgi:glycosyltransferase involved in cell wall biosynthesis